jgi:putative oxidoreductase
MNAPATVTSGNSGLFSKLGSLYSQFDHLAKTYLSSPFLLLVRLYWGWQFAQTGWGKLHNLSHVRDFFQSLGIPAPGIMAPSVAMLEFVGGILLILGLATRLIGFLLAANMFTAYITADREALGTIFSSDPSKFYNADPFTFLFASLIALALGAGAISLDALLARSHRMSQ